MALVLNREAVKRLLTMEDCIEAMVTALTALSSGRAHMPVRSVEKLPLEDDHKIGLLVSMPSYLRPGGSDDSAKRQCFAASKCFTVFPANAALQKPAHQGVTSLFEAETGSLLSIADAHEVTAIRTAAASAVATRALARQGPCKLALLGSGTQARTHFEAIRCVRDIAEVRVWSRTLANSQAFARTLQGQVPVNVFATAAEATSEADIICTLTGCMAKDTPVLTSNMVKPGAHINAVGACQPQFRELDTSIVLASRIFVDTKAACIKEPGDFVIPIKEGAFTEEGIVAEVGTLLAGECEGRQSDDQITLFKSVGAAIEDLCAAAVLYQKAKEEPRGSFPIM